MDSWSLGAVLLLLLSCASTRSARPTLVLSIQDLVCVDCGKELEERASAQPGVKGARFDAKAIELDLDLAPGTPVEPIIAAIEKEPIDGRAIKAILGAGQGHFAPFQSFEPTWDAKVLSQHGEDVPNFAPTPGRTTVVDFYADWCGPCHELDQWMHELLEKDSAKIAYRRLNVVDWDSPLAKHYLGQASELPYVVVLDEHGAEIARLAGFKKGELRAAIERGMQ